MLRHFILISNRVNKDICKIGTQLHPFSCNDFTFVKTKCTPQKREFRSLAWPFWFVATNLETQWYKKQQQKLITALWTVIRCHKLWYGTTKTRFLTLIPPLSEIIWKRSRIINETVLKQYINGFTKIMWCLMQKNVILWVSGMTKHSCLIAS